MTTDASYGWLGWVAIICAALSAAIIVTYLARRPQLGPAWKLWLLMGLGVFPIASAGSANISGFQATQSRKFCGSCHVMGPHADDSNDANSTSLASIHARSSVFGHDNCYTCHKDYGMYGYVLTKLGGMRHVALYLSEYRTMPIEESKHDIRIRAALPNDNCMACHTTHGPRWQKIGDHASALAAVREGRVSCASPGCHGFAHPMTKLGKELLDDGGARP